MSYISIYKKKNTRKQQETQHNDFSQQKLKPQELDFILQSTYYQPSGILKFYFHLNTWHISKLSPPGADSMFVCQWFATSMIPQPCKYNRFLNCSHIFSMYSCCQEKPTIVSSWIPQPSCSGLGSQSTTTYFDTGTAAGSSNEHWRKKF